MSILIFCLLIFSLAGAASESVSARLLFVGPANSGQHLRSMTKLKPENCLFSSQTDKKSYYLLPEDVDLSKYQVVVILPLTGMAPENRTQLTRYVHAGGKLVWL